MKTDGGTVEPTYFQTLGTKITSHPAWSYDDDQVESLHQATEHAFETVTKPGMAELDFLHAPTGSRLHALMPNEESTMALTGTLRQALVPDPIRSVDDGFHTDLEEAYQQIAANHTGPYVEPIRTDSDVRFDLLQLRIPWDYDANTLDEGLDTLGAAAEEAYTLNAAIQDPLKSYLDE